MIRKDEGRFRELLVEYGKKLLADGLVQGTWGNLSVRLDDRYMLATPSGLDYERLTPEDMVPVDCSDLTYDGPRKPTSEKGLHAGIYLQHEDAGAVIHTHSKYCCIFAAANMPLPVEDPALAAELGEFIRIDAAAEGSRGRIRVDQRVDVAGHAHASAARKAKSQQDQDT